MGGCNAWTVFSANNAISVPRNVVLAAVVSPRNSVFHATPQRWPPARQSSPKLRSLATRSTIAPRTNWPSSAKKALLSAFSTGKTMNSASSPAAARTAPATKRSPLNQPRRARPNAETIVSAVNTTKPPHPMPGCALPSSPQRLVSASKAQPCAPIRKPLASSTSNPTPPPISSTAPC